MGTSISAVPPSSVTEVGPSPSVNHASQGPLKASLFSSVHPSLQVLNPLTNTFVFGVLNFALGSIDANAREETN